VVGVNILAAVLACAAPFAAAAWYRDGRNRRRVRRDLVAGLRAELTQADRAVRLLHRSLQWESLQGTIERRHTRAAQNDAEQWRHIACRQLARVAAVTVLLRQSARQRAALWRRLRRAEDKVAALTAANERLASQVERLDLDGADQPALSLVHGRPARDQADRFTTAAGQ
jgi:hypothetical protein